MWWFGPNISGQEGTALVTERLLHHAAKTVGGNVDAADPNEDLAPGQSETAIGAAGSLVMSAWNDATNFIVSPSTLLQASGTGVGFSRDGAKTFTDLVGLPNNNPNEKWSGDPSVVAVDNGRAFLVSSLYLPIAANCSAGPAVFGIAVSVAVVTPNGVEFTNPIVAASGGDICAPGGPTAFLDKDFMTYDPVTRTVAISYTRLTFFPGLGTGQVEVVKAQLPFTPSFLDSDDFSAPIVVWAEEPNIENEGAYPALAYNYTVGADDIYVAWEHNWGSNTFNGDPYVYIYAAQVVAGTTPPVIVGTPDNPVVVTLGQRNSTAFGGVKSLDVVPIPGYNRGTSNDFPRISWNPVRNQVVIVWNDASTHPLGDIFLRSFYPGFTNPSDILKVNNDNSGTLHMFPAVCSLSDGSTALSWYDRRNFSRDSAETDLFAEIRPYIRVNAPDFKVTNVSSNWNADASVIVPNFGDYTDNTCTGTTVYFNWSDGRLGVPQPFVASTSK
jgi:hypothetical protein